MRILILGSSGYIGKHLIKQIKNSKHNLAGFDLRSEFENDNSLRRFYEGNITNISALEECIVTFDPEVIIDLAANTVVDKDYGLKDYTANYCVPKLLQEILTRNQSLSLNRIIFTSTQYVIGPEFSGVNKMSYAPHTSYGVSKVILEQEILVRSTYFDEMGIDYFIVRPTNVWGGNHPKYANMWEKLLLQGVVILPREEIIKSYCHIHTLLELYTELCEVDAETIEKNERILYASDYPMSQTEWVQLQVDAFNHIKKRARYFRTYTWALYSLSLFMSIISKILMLQNPLPRTRVDSMTTHYYVLNNPDKLNYSKRFDDLLPIVISDYIERYE